MDLAAEDANALGALQKTIELVENADAAAGEGGKGRAGNAELWERSPAEDEAGVENEIDDVGDPEQAHGDGGVTRAAKDSVVEEEHHDGAAPSERNARVTGADGNNLR